MKLISKILPTRDFMENYWTTLGNKVYVPTKYDKDQDWGKDTWMRRHSMILEHERIHTEQWEDYGYFLFATIYVGPSVTIGIPLLMTTLIGSIWFGFIPFIIALSLFLLFLPLSVGFAYGRLYMELQAFFPQWANVYYNYGEHALKHHIRIRCKQLWKDYVLTMPTFISEKIAYKNFMKRQELLESSFIDFVKKIKLITNNNK